MRIDEEISEEEFLSFINLNFPEKLDKFIKILNSNKNYYSDGKTKVNEYTICIHPSRKCNLKCKYCFGNEDYLSSDEISLETAIKAINYIVLDYGVNGSLYTVDLSGSGEPLLRIDLIKKLDEYCDRLRNKIGKQILIKFATNATLVSDEIADYELERLFKLRQKDYSEWENANSKETLSDIDEKLLKKIVDDGNESGRIKYEYTDKAAILNKLGLYNSTTDVLTNAGKTLFSQNHPVLLKTAIYATETKDTFIKLNHFEGNIFECIDEGISFILSAIDWNVEISGSAKRSEAPEIPQTAIREMVVNAFAHGCYFANTAFAIEVFSDKVVIYSPGMFPMGFVPEDFAENSAEPIMLNSKIVNVLFKSAVIESFGSGYERTFSACNKAGVKYSYENTKTGFKFIFYRLHGQKNVHHMSKSEKAVYDLLNECDYLTNAQLAKKIGKSEKTIYRAIKGLKDKGFIVREGNDKDGYWKIIK